jgi:hypothetical protein
MLLITLQLNMQDRPSPSRITFLRLRNPGLVLMGFEEVMRQ